MEDLLLKIKDWQTLIGLVAGVVISVLGFYFQKWLGNRSDKKETLRIIEIYCAQTINDLNDLLLTFKNFTNRIDSIIKEIEESPDNEYILSDTNFPPFEFYLDESYAKLKTSSLYLHNKILRMISFVKRLNFELKEHKSNFASFSDKNRFLANGKIPPVQQKNIYKTNLIGFKSLVEKDFKNHIYNTLKILLQVKHYNSELRKVDGFLYKWKQESKSFKFFRNRSDFNKFNNFPNFIDRIDVIVAVEDNYKGLFEKISGAQDASNLL